MLDPKETDMLSPCELAHKRAKDGGQGKLESAVGRDLLFIERNLDFLRPGGRMAVVFPQGRFNNSSDQLRWRSSKRCNGFPRGPGPAASPGRPSPCDGKGG